MKRLGIILTLLLLSGFAHGQSTWYFDGAGSLSDVANWWSNSNGTGSHPANFTAANQVFEIRNTTSLSLTTNWTVSGTGSKVVLGNPAVPAIAMNHTSGDFNATLDVANASTGSNLVNFRTADASTPTLGVLAAGSTVNYGSTLVQTVQAASYGNLTLSGSHGNNNIILSPGVIAVSGTFIQAASFKRGKFVTTGSVFRFNGDDQSIPAFTFNDLECSGTGNKTANGDLTIAGKLTISAGIDLDMRVNDLLDVGSTAGTGRLLTQCSSSNPVPSGVTWTFSVHYNRAGSQRIMDGVYINLNATGGSRIFNSSGTIVISGVFTAGSGSYSVNGSTVEFAGDLQTVPAIDYNNLTISGSNDKTAAGPLEIAGMLTIASGRTLNLGTNRLVTVSSTSGTGVLTTSCTTSTALPNGKTWTFTVSYGSASTQTIAYGNYATLIAAGGNRILTAWGVTGISEAFVPGSGSYSGINSAFDFNGADQSIPGFSYYKLTCSGSGTKTATGDVTVSTTLTVNTPCTLNMASYRLSGLTLTAGTGLLRTQCEAAEPVPPGANWKFGVVYDSDLQQTVVGGTYINLDVDGGDRIYSAYGIITVTGVFNPGAGIKNVLGSTIQFSGGSGQVIPPGTYHNITSTGNGSRVLSSSGTIFIKGNFNPGSNSYTVTGSTIDFNGAAQSIPRFTFNHATMSGSDTKTATGNLTINGTLTIFGGVTLSMGVNQLLGIASTVGTGTLATARTGSLPIPASESWAFNVHYNSASAQTIVQGNYGNLNGSGGARTLIPSGVIRINGAFTPGAGAYTVTSSHVEFGGNSQVIPSFRFNNLSVTGSGEHTASGALTVLGTLAIAQGSTLNLSTHTLQGIVSTSGTGTLKTAAVSAALPSDLTWAFNVTYNGTGAQSIVPGSYNGLSIVNPRGSGTVTFPASTINIAGSFTPLATFTTGSYVTTGSTINFNGSQAQIIPAFTFYNLTFSSTGSRNFTNGVTVVIEGTFTPGTNLCAPGTGTVKFTGAASTIPATTTAVGAADYYHLEVAGGTRTLAAAIEVGGNLTVSGGTLRINSGTSNVLSVWGSYYQTGGSVDMNAGSTGTSQMNTWGSLFHTAGTLTTGGSATNGTITFYGAGSLSVSSPANVTRINFVVGNQSAVTMQSNLNLSKSTIAAAQSSFNVKNGGSLNVRTYAVNESGSDGSCYFAVEAGATFTTAHNLGMDGSIPGANTIKTFSSSASYVFQGSTMGSFATYPVPNAVSSLTIDNPGDVTMTQDINMSGNLTFTNGRLVMNGKSLTVNGTISGTTNFVGSPSSSLIVTGSGNMSDIRFDQSSVSSRTLKNLTINRPSGVVSLATPLEVTGDLTVSNGTLASGGNLKLISNAQGTARITATSGSAAITGNVIVERFIPSSARRWRFMAANTQNATLEDWRQEIYITGPGTGTTGINSNGFDATSANSPSVYSYDETVAGVSDVGWTAPANTSVPLVPGRGYRVFIRGDRSDPGRLNNTVSSQNEVTMNLVGPLVSGDVSVPLTYTNHNDPANDGWNLVGNPYPSQYDWNAFWDAGNSGFSGTYYTNLDPVIYVWDASSNSYKSYNAATNSGTITNGIIASGEGFFVKAVAASPSITFKEQFKSGEMPLQMFKTGTNDEMKIRLTLDSISYDDFILKFVSSATTQLDAYDIRKINNPTANLASYGSDSMRLSLDARPLSPGPDTIRLFVSGATGTFRMSFSRIPFARGKSFFLVDQLLSNIVKIDERTVYTFSVAQSNPASYGFGRFLIVSAAGSALPVEFGTFDAERTASGDVALTWTTISEHNSAYFEVERNSGTGYEPVGKVRSAGNSLATLSYAFTDVQPPFTPVLYYRIRQIDADGSFRYSQERAVKNLKAAIHSAVQVRPNPASGSAVVSLGADAAGQVHITMHSIQGTGIVREGSATIADGAVTLDLNGLPAGIYIVEVTHNDMRHTVKLAVH